MKYSVRHINAKQKRMKTFDRLRKKASDCKDVRFPDIYPTDYFTTVGPPNPSINVSTLHEIPWSALKFCNVLSGWINF